MGYYAAAAAALAQVGVQIHQGEKQQQAQRRAMRNQERVQAEQRNAALSERRNAEEAINRSNQKAPDAEALLESSLLTGKQGGRSTMLTGGLGGLRPNRPSLLGG